VIIRILAFAILVPLIFSGLVVLFLSTLEAWDQWRHSEEL
jgi:hypothetical protein